MANEEHLAILKQGVEVWNTWRNEHPELTPDLEGADLISANLRGANLSGTNLIEANLFLADLRAAYLGQANLFLADLSRAYLDEADLEGAILSSANLIGANLDGADLRAAIFSNADLSSAYLMRAILVEADLRAAKLREARLFSADLSRADLTGANLSGADLIEADLRGTDLIGTDLSLANLSGADLSGADLTGADLRGADLSRSRMLETCLEKTDMTGCRIYGISAWDVKLENTIQKDMVITQGKQPVITVDNLQVAQFIYLLLNNENIREVINTLTTKAVLILGRFTPPRKAVLDALRDELRRHNYLPILFDFDKPVSRDTHETMKTLASLSRFIIADITNPRSIPQELTSVVETLPSVPVQPILRYGARPWGMYDHIRKYPSVLEIHHYRNLETLVASLSDKVIAPAEAKAKEIEKH